MISTLEVNSNNCKEIQIAVESLSQGNDTVESAKFAHACSQMATYLKSHGVLSTEISKWKKEKALLLTGLPFSNSEIGVSPLHWDVPWRNVRYFKYEIMQCLIASMFGKVFGWRTQENGRFLRHIVPIKSVENEQLGGSSKTTLAWHTEEAFHSARASMFVLMCYRNNEKAITKLSKLSDLELSIETRKCLRKPWFVIEPDKSHTAEQNVSENWDADDLSFENRQIEKLEPVALIRDSTNFVVDEAFTKALPKYPNSQRALDEFHKALDDACTDVCMDAGDLLLIDNYAVAHGRSIYQPHYGPNQRWLRRVNVQQDSSLLQEYCETTNERIIP